VRFSGLDVTVWSSDNKRSPGRLARQGSPVLRWALFEAAKSASRTTSPDHAYYVAVRDRLGGKRPALSVARKLVRRCHHTLREQGDEAWAALPARERQAGGLIVLSGTRPRPDQMMFAAGSRQAPVAAACGGRPGKNGQPRNNAG
jgi:hypothetical protein